MKQGEIWLADLNPVVGSARQGIRPIVIISGDAMNNNVGISIVCPLSGKTKNYAGCVEILMDAYNGLETDSEVITFQIRTISHSRLISKTGNISADQLAQIKKGLAEILTY